MGKVLIVAINYAPELTGCGQYTGDFGAALGVRGHHVEVVTTPPHYPGWRVVAPSRNQYSVELAKGGRIFRCPLLLNSQMSGLWRLVAPLSFAVTSAPVVVWRVLTRRPDAVVVVEPTLFSAPVAVLVAKLVGARTVLHLQDLEVDAAFAVGHLPSAGVLKRIGLLFERGCLRGFERIVAISINMGERLMAKGVPPTRVSVVRNWVDLHHIRPLPRSAAYRRELGLPENAYLALYSGNIGPKQGMDVVVEAARLLKDDSRIFFAIAGEGPSKASLMNQAAALPNIRFLPFQPYERLPEFLAMCDIHLLPQMASARPILVTAEAKTELSQFLSGVADIVPPGNASALADAILSSMSRGFSATDAARMIELARKLSRDTAMDQLEAIVLGSVNDMGSARENARQSQQ